MFRENWSICCKFPLALNAWADTALKSECFIRFFCISLFLEIRWTPPLLHFTFFLRYTLKYPQGAICTALSPSYYIIKQTKDNMSHLCNPVGVWSLLSKHSLVNLQIISQPAWMSHFMGRSPSICSRALFLCKKLDVLGVPINCCLRNLHLTIELKEIKPEVNDPKGKSVVTWRAKASLGFQMWNSQAENWLRKSQRVFFSRNRSVPHTGPFLNSLWLNVEIEKHFFLLENDRSPWEVKSSDYSWETMVKGPLAVGHRHDCHCCKGYGMQSLPGGQHRWKKRQAGGTGQREEVVLKKLGVKCLHFHMTWIWM